MPLVTVGAAFHSWKLGGHVSDLIVSVTWVAIQDTELGNMNYELDASKRRILGVIIAWLQEYKLE